MPLLETSSEEILPMAMLRRQQAQGEARPPTPLERAYGLLAESPPLTSRWAQPLVQATAEPPWPRSFRPPSA